MPKKSTKPSLCEKVYIDKKGVEYKVLPEDPSDIVARVFKFADGTTRTLAPKEFPKSIQHGALLAGFGYVGAAALNGAENVAEAIEAYDARIATMMEGKWSDRGVGDGSGTRDSAVVAAIFAAAEEQGRMVNARKTRDYMLAVDVEDGTDSEANILAVRKARSERRARWLKNADVARHYERIKAERQLEKAAKVAASVPDEPQTDGDEWAEVA